MNLSFKAPIVFDNIMILNIPKFKNILFYLFILIVFAILCPRLLATQENKTVTIPIKKNKLRTIIVDDYYPYTFVNKDGAPDGFSIDLAKEVIKVMGMELMVRLDSWDHAKTALKNGEIDFLPMMAYSKERDKIFDFSVPHTIAYDGLFTRVDSAKIKSIYDLAGKKIIVMENDQAHDYLRSTKNLKPENFILVNGIPDALRLLSSGKGDVALIPMLVGLIINKDLNLINLTKSPAIVDEYDRHFSFAVKKGNQALLVRLIQGLNIVKNTGQYDEIYNKWFGPVLPHFSAGLTKTTKNLLFIVFLILCLIGIIGFTGVWYLRKEVARKTKHLKEEIKERKQMEEALQESETHLRTLIETIPDLVWLKNSDSVYISCNPKFERLFGAKEADIKGKTDYDFVDKKLADVFRERDKAAIAVASPIINEEEVTYADDGHKELLEIIKTPLYNSEGKLVGVLSVARDITERKRAENLVRDYSQMLMQAQERERKMLSCELHDTIAQDLSTLKIYCKLFEGQLSSVSDIKGSPADAFKLIDQIIFKVRNLAYGLSPSSLDDLGLVHTLENICEEFIEKKNITVDFQATGIHESALNSDTKINLYRLVAEGLNNIRKHAEASKADIRLVGASSNIILRIEDDGKGFDVKERERSIVNEKRMGLRSMKERVNLLQGQMSIHSQLNKGTEIVIELPLRRNKNGSKKPAGAFF